MSTSLQTAAPRKATLAFIFIVVVMDVLALGIIIPVLPKLVVTFLNGDTARGAQVYGIFTAWALMQFVFSPMLGTLSDRWGRRPVILISCFGLGLDYVFMALAPSLGWLFAGRIISGITAASITTAGAYIADVTPPEKRAAGFGLIGAAWGLGFVLGPALGGVLGGIDPRLPFWAAAGLALLNGAYGLFVLPESLPPSRREGFSWAKANPVGSLKLLRSHPELFGLAGVYILYYVAHYVLPSVCVLYATYRYGWSATTMGLTLAGVGICNILVQGRLVKPIVKQLGERRMLLAGLLFGGAGFAIYGFAPTSAAFWIGVPVFSLIGLFGPAAQGIMSRLVKPSEQGQLQGANNSLMGLCGMFAPLLFTEIFAYAINPQHTLQLPGAPFLLAAGLMIVASIIAWRVTANEPAATASGSDLIET